MKDKFFKLVGGFSLIMASIAILVAIVSGISASNQFFGSANEDIDYPNIELKTIHSSKMNSEIKKDKSVSKNKNSTDREDKGYFENLGIVWNSILASLNEFAKTTNQGSVNEKGLEEYLIKNTNNMSREDYLIFLDNFSRASKDLNDRSADIAALGPEDEAYIRWADDFLPWFIQAYTNEYSQELQRIQDEKVDDKVRRAGSLVTAGTAAGAFLFFIFFTLILLMVQIEKNTRRS